MDNSGISSGENIDTGGSTIQSGDVYMEKSVESTPLVENISKVDEIKTENSTVTEIKIDDADRIMNIPGTAHDKLSGLAHLSDEETERESVNIQETQKDTNSEQNENKFLEKSEKLELDENELSFEEQIIKLQAETMKVMAESMHSSNNKEAEDLMKKLKKLLEQIEKDNGINKESLMTGVLAVMMLVMNIIEGSYKKLESEVKVAEG